MKILISLEEYRELIKKSTAVEILRDRLDMDRYVAMNDIRAILGMEKEKTDD